MPGAFSWLQPPLPSFYSILCLLYTVIQQASHQRYGGKSFRKAIIGVYIGCFAGFGIPKYCLACLWTIIPCQSPLLWRIRAHNLRFMLFLFLYLSGRMGTFPRLINVCSFALGGSRLVSNVVQNNDDQRFLEWCGHFSSMKLEDIQLHEVGGLTIIGRKLWQ